MPPMLCGLAQMSPFVSFASEYTPEQIQVDDNPPTLAGRKARCAYGNHAIVDSSPDLAFFEHKPDKEMDEYYCGCHGWD